MSDVGETVQLEDVWEDIDAEMGYLMNLVERQSERSAWADSIPESAPDLIRALVAAGATPGEVRASVAEIYSPPR
eukprot:7269407-Alexandrium_andersonii.AAC.1